MRDGFNASELTMLNTSAEELKAGGYSAQDCKVADVSAREAGFSSAEVMAEG